MQLHLTLTDSQVGYVKDVVNICLIPFIGWLVRQSRNKINEIITTNVNRIRDEIMGALEAKLKSHEETEIKFIQEAFDKMRIKEGH